MRQVIQLAKTLHWRVYHPGLSKWSERGWPDLAMVRGNRLILSELKSDKGKLTDAQEEWIEALGETYAEVYVWRPTDWDAILKTLAGPR